MKNHVYHNDSQIKFGFHVTTTVPFVKAVLCSERLNWIITSCQQCQGNDEVSVWKFTTTWDNNLKALCYNNMCVRVIIHNKNKWGYW